MAPRLKKSVKYMLEDHKARVAGNLLLTCFYDNHFNDTNIDMFKGCVAHRIATLPEKYIEVISFKQISQLTLFAHELRNLYLTFRDAMAMLPGRNKERDIVELETYNNALAGMPYRVFEHIFESYDFQISNLESKLLTTTTNGDPKQFVATKEGELIPLEDLYGPNFSWKRLFKTPVIANSGCGPS
jgi:hypothetical protein